MSVKNINRRKFVHWLGIGWFISILSGAISACSNQNSNSPTNTETSPSNNQETAVKPPSDGFIEVGTVADLDREGKIVTSGTTPLLVIRDPENTSKLLAVNPICPHQGCTADWNADKKNIVCSCHGSTFSAMGEVIKGPASKPLKRYEAEIKGDVVLVKA